jgi:hypothetical protein
MPKKDFQNWSKEKLLHEYKELLKHKKFGIGWEDKIEEMAEQCKTSFEGRENKNILNRRERNKSYFH